MSETQLLKDIKKIRQSRIAVSDEQVLRAFYRLPLKQGTLPPVSTTLTPMRSPKAKPGERGSIHTMPAAPTQRRARVSPRTIALIDAGILFLAFIIVTGYWADAMSNQPQRSGLPEKPHFPPATNQARYDLVATASLPVKEAKEGLSPFVPSMVPPAIFNITNIKERVVYGNTASCTRLDWNDGKHDKISLECTEETQ